MELFYYGKAGAQHYDTKTGQFVTDPNDQVNGVDYTDAIVRTVGLGVPYATAVQLANFYYPEGQHGRPGTGPHFVNGHLVSG
jgi:hypothetical protein